MLVASLRSLIASAALLLICSVTNGCEDEDGGAVAEDCSMAALLIFEGRQYTAASSLDGMDPKELEVGVRLGTGELPACGDGPGQPVRVFEIVGVRATKAVYAKPAYGLMERSD